MWRLWSILAILLAGATFVPITSAPGQEKKPEKETKPKRDPTEILLKGNLTGLEQEVSHALSLRKGQDYMLSVESRGFFTHVRVDNENGKEIASLSAAGVFKAPDDGIFRFLVSSPGGSSGQYVISLKHAKVTPTKAGEVLTVGTDGVTLDGVLSKDDPLDKARKTHCRLYDVKMKSGATYVIDMMSKHFDAFLRLEDAAGKQLAQDDDSGGGNNARIRFRAPSEGVYRVIATTFAADTGLFTLKIREENEKSEAP